MLAALSFPYGGANLLANTRIILKTLSADVACDDGAPGKAYLASENGLPESYRKVARHTSRRVTLGEPRELRSLLSQILDQI